MVNLTHPALVGDTVLEPGHYEFREVAPNLVQIFDKDVMRAEVAVHTFSTERNMPAEETMIRFRGIGGNQYYIDKMWIQGRNIGYDFEAPARVKSLQQEQRTSPVAPSL